MKLSDTQIQYLKDEFRSFIVTFGTLMSIEAVTPLSSLYSGDFGKTTFIALMGAILRSLYKTILTLAFPVLFPQRTSQLTTQGTDSQKL